ncbi:MAG: TIGR02117 family protein [Sphingomicrobium sp.]
MARRSRTRSRTLYSLQRRSNRSLLGGLVRKLLVVLAAIPALYLLAALVGSLIPTNAVWSEPAQGETVYLVSNGIHTDLILPAEAEGLDWRPLLPRGDFANPDPDARWIAFGMGERRVYLETPHWRDIRLRTVWAALTGGERVMHAEWVADPSWQARTIRLRPEEYRRLWAAVRANFRLDPSGRPQRIDHPGYGPDDAFYRGVGRASAINTCNTWAADMLRLAGLRTSLWPPFSQGLAWRYRKADQRT